MTRTKAYKGWAAAGWLSTALFVGAVMAADNSPPTSYSPVVIKEDFSATVQRMSAAKEEIMDRHMKLLEERYDLSDRPAQGVTMSRGKPVQAGVRVKLPAGVKSWEELGAMSPEQIRAKGLWPEGFLPLPHPNHPEGGMVFPKHHIDEITKQEGRGAHHALCDFRQHGIGSNGSR